MIAYWSIFLASLFPVGRSRVAQNVFWGTVFVALVLLIGYRIEVGCDWDQYFFIFKLSQQSLTKAINVIDPGYGLLNYFVGQTGSGYVYVNLIGAAIFATGLLIFVRHQPNPGLALVVAIPYMIVVVAMGYTRQAIALSFLMVALTRLGDGRNTAFFVFVLIGALFHKTVVVLLPLGLIGMARGRGLTNWLMFGFAIWFGIMLVIDSADTLWTNYVDAQMQSEGALIRVAMNAVAAVAFLMFRRQWDRHFDDGYLWVWIAYASLACLPMLSVATTAVDRMALYFLPLQVIVFSRLPLLIQGREFRQLAAVGITAGYALVLFVWLNFATHANCWVPYKSALFN